MKASLLVMVAAVLLVPVPARGDGYVNPWIGINLLDSTDSGRTAFGVTAGYMGGGVFGFEGDFGYSPEIFGSRVDLGDNTAIELMGNFILGVPIGGTHGAGVRPFVSGGLGVIRAAVPGGAGRPVIEDQIIAVGGAAGLRAAATDRLAAAPAG